MSANLLKKTAYLIALPSLLLCSSAFADCEEMGNSRWNSLSDEMSKAYQNGNYEEAINYGKNLILRACKVFCVNALSIINRAHSRFT